MKKRLQIKYTKKLSRDLHYAHARCDVDVVVFVGQKKRSEMCSDTVSPNVKPQILQKKIISKG